ncbi:MAG: type II secretion system F family protein, partial [Oscillospiraceae bacterium]
MAKTQLSHRELSAFCEQLAMLLKAGIPIGDGLDMMLQDTSLKEGKEILQTTYNEYEKGGGLHNALDVCGVFPKYMLDMVKIGEVSGHLDNVMHALSQYYDRERQVSDNVRSAVRYPAVMIVMMLAVVGVLVVKVMPVFGQVFSQLGSEMSGVSAAIIHFGELLSKYSVVLVVIAAMLLALWVYCTKTQKGKKLAEIIAQKNWLTKGVYAKIADARFASGLSLMLSSGID